MRIAASPLQQASLSHQAIWWRGDGDLAFKRRSNPTFRYAAVWIASLRSQ
jgi:hypothetical protein